MKELAVSTLLAAFLLAAAVLSAGRAAGLARATVAGQEQGGTEAVRLARTARNESRWYGWAQRHPRMLAAVADAAPRVAAGARVLWVVPPQVDPKWLQIAVLYRLPAAWPAAVVRRGSEGAEVDADVRVDLYGDGSVEVAPAVGRGRADRPNSGAILAP